MKTRSKQFCVTQVEMYFEQAYLLKPAQVRLSKVTYSVDGFTSISTLTHN